MTDINPVIIAEIALWALSDSRLRELIGIHLDLEDSELLDIRNALAEEVDK